MGWSTSMAMCMEGSTTECYECPTMDGCEVGSCADECYEYDPMKTCQCSAGNCEDYGTCCDDNNSVLIGTPNCDGSEIDDGCAEKECGDTCIVQGDMAGSCDNNNNCVLIGTPNCDGLDV